MLTLAPLKVEKGVNMKEEMKTQGNIKIWSENVGKLKFISGSTRTAGGWSTKREEEHSTRKGGGGLGENTKDRRESFSGELKPTK